VVTGLLWLLLRRLGMAAIPAALAAWTVLFLGNGSPQFLFPFQIGWGGPLAIFLAVLLILDRESPRRDYVAAALLTIGLLFSGVAVALTGGIVVALAVTGEWRRALRVGLAPAAVYVLWYLGWGTRQALSARAIRQVPEFAATAWSSQMSGLTGLGRTVGAVLSVALLMAVVARFARGEHSLAALAALSAAAIFATLSGLSRLERFGVESAAAPRYVYIGAVLFLVAAAWATRPAGPDAHWPVTIALAALLGAALLSNVAALDVAIDDRRFGAAKSEARVTAAYTLIEQGLPYVGAADPDPELGGPLTAAALARIDGADFEDRVELTVEDLAAARSRLQTAVGPPRPSTARLAVLGTEAATVFDFGDGCAEAKMDPGGIVMLDFSEGTVRMTAFGDDAQVEITRVTEAPEVPFSFALAVQRPVSIELAAPVVATDTLELRSIGDSVLRFCGAELSS
jgi:hypothetical protein